MGLKSFTLDTHSGMSMKRVRRIAIAIMSWLCVLLAGALVVSCAPARSPGMRSLPEIIATNLTVSFFSAQSSDSSKHARNHKLPHKNARVTAVYEKCCERNHVLYPCALGETGFGQLYQAVELKPDEVLLEFSCNAHNVSHDGKCGCPVGDYGVLRVDTIGVLKVNRHQFLNENFKKRGEVCSEYGWDDPRCKSIPREEKRVDLMEEPGRYRYENLLVSTMGANFLLYAFRDSSWQFVDTYWWIY